VLLASQRSVLSRAIVLALGIPPTRAPWRSVDQGVPRHLLAPDPWESGALDEIPPSGEVVVVGSGLTAIDMVGALRRRGHRGTITLVSRSGRLPLPHATRGSTPERYDPSRLCAGVREALCTVRRAARQLVAAGGDWQAAIDGVRPLAATIWQAWTIDERARFLRRLRPFWEIHRHRAPESVLSEVRRECEAGTVRILAGTVYALRGIDPTRAEVVVQSKRGELQTIEFVRLLNCTGPSMSIADTVDPLLGSMLRLGLASPDPLGLGLRSDLAGQLIGADGTVRGRIRMIGALRRGDLWETTAVPELRDQVATVTTDLVADLGLPTSNQ
jgi:uncharacterized NAD(P)/FAD-binding protein YdhS